MHCNLRLGEAPRQCESRFGLYLRGRQCTKASHFSKIEYATLPCVRDYSQCVKPVNSGHVTIYVQSRVSYKADLKYQIAQEMPKI